ncbi:unnamed protein product, partial [Gordionus sp. m RMFG-2023]
KRRKIHTDDSEKNRKRHSKIIDIRPLSQKICKDDESKNESKEDNQIKKRYSKYKQTLKSNFVENGFSKLDSYKTEVLALGEGDVGQLGLGEDVLSATYPKTIKDLIFKDDKIVKIFAGGMHSICLSNNKKLYSFGCNDDGALGRFCENDELEKVPREIEFEYNIDIINITTGDSHSSALTNNGKVYTWGVFRDENGILGLISNKVERKPVLIDTEPVESIVEISSGNNHMLLLTNHGIVLSLGSSEQGQLGRIPARSCTKEQRRGIELFLEALPVSFPLFKGKTPFIKKVFGTSYGSFAIENLTNKIYSWGLNNYKQIGYKSKRNDLIEYFPVVVNWDIAHEIKQITGGPHHTLILDFKGYVYSMGRKEYGRLGLGELNSDIDTPTPILLFKDNPCREISCGECVSYAITESGESYSWGTFSTSQLGNGDTDEDSLIPKRMKGKQLENKNVISLSAGGQHTLLLAYSTL